jgi:WD40 repeat protein
VLVDGRHLLTAAHVLRHMVTGQTESPDLVELVFPAIMVPDSDAARAYATRVPEPSGGRSLDAAVLDLGEHPPAWLPAPVPLSPARRLPRRVSVFGFPKAEADLRGVWREFDVAGPTAAGSVQADWVRQVGTLPGHSGGPVLDPASGMVVGVLVEGAAQGQFDRFVPASQIGDSWPQLPRPWLLTGAGADATDHFLLRAYGQRLPGRSEDLFRGRQAALAVVRDWLTAPHAPGVPLVITGSPGAGKSSVAARAVIDLRHAGIGPGVAFHARSATDLDLLRAVADLMGVEDASSTGGLITAAARLGAGPWLVVVDALDEVATVTARSDMVRLLIGLAGLPGMRIAVATRPLTSGTQQARYQPGGLLYDLMVRSDSSPTLVDLDTDRFFDPAGVADYAEALLTQVGVDRPTPHGAWATYRADRRLCHRLAVKVAAQAQRNYMVAGLAADALAAQPDPVDPTDPHFELAGIPASVGEAVDKYLNVLTDQDPALAEQVRGLLTALAYGRGAGIDNHLWLDFAAALGYQAGVPQLQQLRRSPASDYLLQTVPSGEGAPVTRLFHQALIEELLHRRAMDGFLRSDDEAAILAVLHPHGWAVASGYARIHAGEHAAACWQLPALLHDPDYLAVADLTRLPPLLPAQPDPDLAPIATVLRHAATDADPLPPPRRMRLLALTAAHDGLPNLGQHLAGTFGGTPRWAHSLGQHHQVLTGHTDPVWAVAVGRAGGRDIIVSGGDDRTVRIWDAVTGQSIGEPLTGHPRTVYAVAAGQAGGRDIIVSGSSDDTVRIWDAVTGQPVGEPLTGHTGTVGAVAAGQAGGRDIIVSAGGEVQIWDAVTGQSIGEPLTGGTGRISAVAVGRAGGRDIIVSGSTDGAVWIWDAVSRQLIGHPLTGHTEIVDAVAVGRAGGRDVIVSGSRGAVRIWDAVTGQPVGDPLTGQTVAVGAVAVGRAGGRDVIVTGSGNTVRIWNAVTGQPVGDLLSGPTGRVTSVAAGQAGGRDVIVSGSHDHTVRIWETEQPIGHPLAGHSDTVMALATALDAAWLASGGWDGTVRIWDAVTGQPVGDPLTGHTGVVWAVAAGRAGGRDVIVSVGDHTVRIWDPVTKQPTGEPITTSAGPGQHAVAMGRIADRDVIVVGWYERVRIWDAVTGQPIGEPLAGHTDTVWEVAVGRAGGRDVIVSGSHDHTVRIWDAVTGQPIWRPLTGHTAPVMTVAVGRAGGRDVIVSGSRDHTVRIWDQTGQPLTVVDQRSEVRQVVLAAGSLFAAAGRAIAAFDMMELLH